MPAVSEKQKKFMRAVANSPKFAKKVGVPQSVGKEFTMKKMKMGGGVAPSKMGAVKTAAPSRDGVATKGKTRGTMVKMAAGGMAKEPKSMMKKEVEFMKKKGAPKSMIKHEMKEAGMKKMRYGGKC